VDILDRFPIAADPLTGEKLLSFSREGESRFASTRRDLQDGKSPDHGSATGANIALRV